MRILGIDPGSRITGFGVIERSGGRLVYVDSGCIRAGDGDFPGRLKIIFDGVSEIVRQHAPQAVAIEQVFLHRNPDSALKLGQARGAALCAALAIGVAVHQYMPAAIKQATVGKGNASKAQVQHMVQALLGLSATPQADAADALAVAICHLNSAAFGERVPQAQGRKPRSSWRDFRGTLR